VRVTKDSPICIGWSHRARRDSLSRYDRSRHSHSSLCASEPMHSIPTWSRAWPVSLRALPRLLNPLRKRFAISYGGSCVGTSAQTSSTSAPLQLGGVIDSLASPRVDTCTMGWRARQGPPVFTLHPRSRIAGHLHRTEGRGNAQCIRFHYTSRPGDPAAAGPPTWARTLDGAIASDRLTLALVWQRL
jgi:hypothetical protein